MRAALMRFRAIAYVVGVVLIVLVVIGMPLKYLADEPVIVETVGPAHGFLYMVYLVAVFDLGRRARWPVGRMIRVMLAGTIPFVSFYAERVATRWITAEVGARKAAEQETGAGQEIGAGGASAPTPMG